MKGIHIVLQTLLTAVVVGIAYGRLIEPEVVVTSYVANTELALDDNSYGERMGDLSRTPNQAKPPLIPNTGPLRARARGGRVADTKYFFNLAALTYCNNYHIISMSSQFATRLGPEVELQQVIENPFLQTKAIITSHHQRREIAISFRGTNNAMNSFTNLLLTKSILPSNRKPPLLVHTGFYVVAKSLAPQYLAALRQLMMDPQHRGYHLVFLGHSLGGAAAQLASVITQEALQVPWSRIKLYTYGQPRVGNLQFARWYNSRPVTVTRVVNGRDLVPHLPPMLLGYVHGFHELYLTNLTARACSTKYLEDPNCSSSRFLDPTIDDHGSYWDMSTAGASCQPN